MDLKTQHEIRKRLKAAFLNLTPEEFDGFIATIKKLALEDKNPEAIWLYELLIKDKEK